MAELAYGTRCCGACIYWEGPRILCSDSITVSSAGSHVCSLNRMAGVTFGDRCEHFSPAHPRTFGKDPSIGWFLLLYAAVLLFLIFPGMVAAGAFNSIFSLHLTPGSMLAYAVAMSVLIFVAVWIVCGSFKSSGAWYCGISVMCIIMLFITGWPSSSSEGDSLFSMYLPSADVDVPEGGSDAEHSSAGSSQESAHRLRIKQIDDRIASLREEVSKTQRLQGQMLSQKSYNRQAYNQTVEKIGRLNEEIRELRRGKYRQSSKSVVDTDNGGGNEGSSESPQIAGRWQSAQGDRIVISQDGQSLTVESHRASGGVRWRASGSIDAAGNISLRTEYTKSKKVVSQLGRITSSGERVIHRNGSTAKTFPWSRSSSQQSGSSSSSKGSSVVGAWSAVVGKHKTSWMFTKDGTFLTNKGKKGRWKYEDDCVLINLEKNWIKLSYPIRYTGTKGVSSGGHKVEATRK